MKLNSILVLLNYPRPKGLLKIATELAHKTGAELRAVYMEDPSLFEVSSFSFSKQVSGFRGEILQFSEEQLVQQSKALAARFEKIFTTYTRSLNIKHTYRIVRGYNSDEFDSLVSEVDLFVMPGNLRQAEYWNKLSEQLAAPTLVWNDGSDWSRKIIGICGVPKKSVELVKWTIELGQMMNGRVHLLWNDKKMSSLDKLDDIFDTKKDGPALLKRIKDISVIQSTLSVDFLSHLGDALLVVSRDDTDTNSLLRSLSNSVLLI